MDYKKFTGRILRLGVYASSLLVVAGLLLNADAVLSAGILVLIATPLARVAVLGLGYAAQRRWRWAGVSALVLAAIALSAFIGVKH